MAKRKQRSPYKNTIAFKGIPASEREPPTPIEDYEALTGYDVDDYAKKLLRDIQDKPEANRQELNKKQEERILQLRGLLEPKREMSFGLGGSAPLPPHPYPFKNPLTMTKDIDTSVKELRTKYAPGAGTARTTIMDDKPPLDYITSMMEPGRDREGILTGRLDPGQLSLRGLSENKTPKVYVAPGLKEYKGKQIFDNTVAHELSHRNEPMVEDSYGNPIEGPGAEFMSNLYDKIKERERFPKGTPKTGRDKFTTLDEYIRRLSDQFSQSGIKNTVR